MQPFDDRIPEEVDDTAIVGFLGHVYVREVIESSVGSNQVDTEEMQAVSRVRERLLQLIQEGESPIAGRPAQIDERVKNVLALPKQTSGWQQRVTVLALVAAVLLLVASSFFVTSLAQQHQVALGNPPQVAADSYILPPGKHGSLLISDMLQADQVSRSLLQGQQFTQINQSRMVDGYQVTLDRAYMDANIVLLGLYAVMPYAPQADLDGQKDQYFLPIQDNHFRLTAARGVQLPSIGSSAARDMSNVRHEQKGVLLGFDGAGIQAAAAQVALNFQMDVHCQGWPPNDTCPKTVNFSFTLPFHAAKQVTTPQQAVTQNGKTLTLERVVITQSEARFYMGGWTAVLPAPTPVSQSAQPKSYDEVWYNIKLSVANKTYDLCTLMTPLNCPQGARTGATSPRHQSVQFLGDTNDRAVYLHNDQAIPGFSLLEPLNEHGKMSITITKKLLHYVRDTATAGYSANPSTMIDDKSAAPWIIEFVLP